MNNKSKKTEKPIIKKQLKAYDNFEFIHSEAGREIRILAEYHYPEHTLNKKSIDGAIIFFGSARPDESTVFYQEAMQTAELISNWFNTLADEYKYIICTGGGPGLMQAANHGAYNADYLSAGFNISLPFEQIPNPYINEDLNFEFHYFFMRKFWFASLAKAIIVMPGGFGTLDELFELLTLRQTKKISHEIPICLYNENFWKRLIDFDYLVELGFIKKDDMKLFKFCNTPSDTLEWLKSELKRINKVK